MDKAKRKPGSIIKRALLNQYNYILLGSAALFSITTGSWLPAVIGAGAEVLWLVVGADTSAFRHWVERQESKEERERLAREAAELIGKLDEHYVRRFQQLSGIGDEIQALARENKGLEAVLLKDEMSKLGQLMQSFLRMATSHQRLSRYMDGNPVGEIERDIARSQRTLKSDEDPRVQASVKQALALAQKRLAQHEQIGGALKALSVKMDTLEKSFDYLKSHILGIGSGEELAAELDNVVNGVASVAELEADTQDLMRELRVSASAGAATQSRN